MSWHGKCATAMCWLMFFIDNVEEVQKGSVPVVCVLHCEYRQFLLLSLPTFVTAPVSALLGCCSFFWLCSMFDIQCESASRSQALSHRHLQDVSTYRLGLLKLNDSGSPKRTSVLPWSGGGEQKAVGDRVIGLKLCGVNRADGVRKNAAKWHNFTVVGM